MYNDVRHVSQLAVAQRRLGVPCERFWRELKDREHVALDVRSLATVYHAYATLAQQRKAAGIATSDGPCSKLEERIVTLTADLDSQAAANCAWAIATLERTPQGLVRDGLLAAARRTAQGMNPQNVANTLWACAKLECKPDSGCFAALLAGAERSAPSMNPQGVANTLWAVARLDPAALVGPLRRALMRAAEREAPRMNAQNVSNTLLALAAAGVQPHLRHSSALLQAVRQQSSRMNEQDVANSMWSLAILQLKTGDEVSERLQEAALQRAPHMNAQAVCNTLWALTYYQACRSQPAAVALVHALLERAGKLSDSILSNISCCLQVSSPGVMSGLLLTHQCMRIHVQKRLAFRGTAIEVGCTAFA